MKRFYAILLLAVAMMAGEILPAGAAGDIKDTNIPAATEKKPALRKVLFIGDSMTGWLAERLNAYGADNGFEVATVVWDGSTIRKWGAAQRLRELITEQAPDAVFVSLGMNELFEKNPEARLGTSLDKIIKAVGDCKLIWVGPPSWPGHEEGKVLDDWLAERIGADSYFSSLGLDIPRQAATNPHPSKQGIIEWVDTIAAWLPSSAVAVPRLRIPERRQMVRGKTFIYKRMKEQL